MLEKDAEINKTSQYFFHYFTVSIAIPRCARNKNQLKILISYFVLSCTKYRYRVAGKTKCKSALSFLHGLWNSSYWRSSGAHFKSLQSDTPYSELQKLLWPQTCCDCLLLGALSKQEPQTVHKPPLFCSSACQQGRSRRLHQVPQKEWLL